MTGVCCGVGISKHENIYMYIKYSVETASSSLEFLPAGNVC